MVDHATAATMYTTAGTTVATNGAPAAPVEERLYTQSSEALGYILDDLIPLPAFERGSILMNADIMYQIKLLVRPENGLDTLTWPVDSMIGHSMLVAILERLREMRRL